MLVLALVSKRDFYGYELVETISKKIEISEGPSLGRAVAATVRCEGHPWRVRNSG